MYYYIDHLYGTLFSSKKELTLKDLYCDECGDYDTELGYFESEEEAMEAYAEYLGFDSYAEYKESMQEVEEEN